MSLQQLSIIVENRPGSLASTFQVLADAGIDINGVSVSDTTEFGVLRMILSDPAKGEEVLQENGFVVKATDVLAIDVNDTPHAMIIFKTEDNRRADEILQEEGMHALTSDEVHARLYS